MTIFTVLPATTGLGGAAVWTGSRRRGCLEVRTVRAVGVVVVHVGVVVPDVLPRPYPPSL